MKIIREEESREQCTEAGWYAYDYLLEREMTQQDILRLPELGGSLVYLSKLKQPFYKLEDSYLMLKGVQGKDTLRVAVYREYETGLCEKVRNWIQTLE